MILNVSGIGESGSSAVIDYLRQYSEIKVIDTKSIHVEFQIIHMADGINDLKYHLVTNHERIACNAAIKRFSRLLKYGLWSRGMRAAYGSRFDDWCQRLTNDIIQVRWKGKNSGCDPIDIKNSSRYQFVNNIEKQIYRVVHKLNSNWEFPPKQDKYFAMFSELDFNELIKKYMAELCEMIDIDNSKINILDQLFSSTNMKQGTEFFDDARSIIVVRDPRDIYASAQINKQDSRFMPIDDVHAFVKYYQTLRRNVVADETAIVIQYEDLIYKYKTTVASIQRFLGLSNLPEKEFSYLNPVYGIKYTNRKDLYKYVESDISVIERDLCEYLYDFDNVDSPLYDTELISHTSRVEYNGFNHK